MLPRKPGHHAFTESGNAMHLPKLIGTTCSSENPSPMHPQNSAMPSTHFKSSSRPSARRTRYCQVLAASYSATDPEHLSVPRTPSIPCTRRTYQRQAPAELIKVEMSKSFRRLNQALRRTHQALADIPTAHCSAFDDRSGASSRRTPHAPRRTYPSSACRTYQLQALAGLIKALAGFIRALPPLNLAAPGFCRT